MKLAVLVATDRKGLEALLKEDWVKRLGPVVRENLGGKEGTFLVVKADEKTLNKLIETGLLKIPEDEEDLLKAYTEEEEAATAGVGLLGL